MTDTEPLPGSPTVATADEAHPMMEQRIPQNLAFSYRIVYCSRDMAKWVVLKRSTYLSDDQALHQKSGHLGYGAHKRAH